MPNYAFTHDVGSLLKTAVGLTPVSITPSSAASTNVGTIFDRFATPTTADAQERVNSVKAVAQLAYLVSTGASALTINCHLLHSSSTGSTTFVALETKSGSTSFDLAAPAGSSVSVTADDIASANYDLATADRYLRLRLTHVARASIGASSLATEVASGTLIFGGSNQNPPSS